MAPREKRLSTPFHLHYVGREQGSEGRPDHRGQAGPLGGAWRPSPHAVTGPRAPHLVAAPVVHGDDGDAKDDARPGQVPRDGVPEDVERIGARDVAFRRGSPVPVLDYAGLRVGILMQELIVPSHFLEGLETTQNVSEP